MMFAGVGIGTPPKSGIGIGTVGGKCGSGIGTVGGKCGIGIGTAGGKSGIGIGTAGGKSGIGIGTVGGKSGIRGSGIGTDEDPVGQSFQPFLTSEPSARHSMFRVGTIG